MYSNFWHYIPKPFQLKLKTKALRNKYHINYIPGNPRKKKKIPNKQNNKNKPPAITKANETKKKEQTHLLTYSTLLTKFINP